MQKIFLTVIILVCAFNLDAQIKTVTTVVKPAVNINTKLNTTIVVSNPNPALTGATVLINTGNTGLDAAGIFYITLLNKGDTAITKFSFVPPSGNTQISYPAGSQKMITLNVQNTGAAMNSFLFPAGTAGLESFTAGGGINFHYTADSYGPLWTINSVVLTLYFQGGMTKTITWSPANITANLSTGNNLLFDENFNAAVPLYFIGYSHTANHPGGGPH